MLDSRRVKETLIIKDIESTAKTLREMVDYLKEESQGKDEEINRIIRVNHPIVNRLKQVLNINYNIYIEETSDLEALFKSREYKFVDDLINDHYWERQFKRGNDIVWRRIYIDESLFEENKLKYIKQADWNDDFIRVEEVPEEDLPF
jgi:hypoxanthine phosphoribosyltransferase